MIVYLITTISLSFISCEGNQYKTNNTMTVKYYKGFSGYSHPIKLIEEISEAAAEGEESYMIGTFQNDLLIKAEKRLTNKTFFIYEYIYERNKIKAVEITNKNGEVKLVYINLSKN